MKIRTSLFFLVTLLAFSTILSSCASPPRMQDLQLNTDENLYAGEGEICKNQYIEVNCAEDLECIEITTNPHIIAKCYPKGYQLEEDLTYRPGSINTSE